MKDIKDNLITIGELKKEIDIKPFYGYTLLVNIPDGSTLNVMSASLDKDGDLCLEVDEDVDEGYLDIGQFLHEVRGVKNDTKMYLKGFGLYLTFKEDLNFSVDDDDESLSLDAYAVGEYELPIEGKPKLTRKEKKEKRIYYWSLVGVSLIILGGLLYNVRALLTQGFTWGYLAGAVFSFLLLGLGVTTLAHPEIRDEIR